MKALAKLGFSQSYTYFTWRNGAGELREYVTELTHTDVWQYLRPNFFANTPDILHAYLQTGGRNAFRVRLLLAATLSPSYGIYSGFELCENMPAHAGSEEYLDSEKYQIKWRDWHAHGNINEDVACINRIRRQNWSLQLFNNVQFLESENEHLLAYWKTVPGGKNDLFVVVNTEIGRAHEGAVHVPVHELCLGHDASFEVEDLLTGECFTWRGARNFVRLDPAVRVGHVMRLKRPGVLGAVP